MTSNNFGMLIHCTKREVEGYLRHAKNFCDIKFSHSSRPSSVEHARNFEELGTHLKSIE